MTEHDYSGIKVPRELVTREYGDARRSSMQVLAGALVLVGLALAGWGTAIVWDGGQDEIRGLALIGGGILVAIFARMVQAESR